ncbi:MAG: DNA polymerase III subunit chi [Salinisphaeraceae bacterium]
MTEVSFYIVEAEGADAGMRTACRLAEKAHDQGHRVYLHVADAAAAQTLDGLLWTFRQGSFVPHLVATARGEQDPTPVVIGHDAEPPGDFDDVLISLTDEVPAFFSRFARSLEIVTPANRLAARQRYRFYQERGYPLETHKIA